MIMCLRRLEALSSQRVEAVVPLLTIDESTVVDAAFHHHITAGRSWFLPPHLLHEYTNGHG